MDGNTRGAHGAWYIGAYEYEPSDPTPSSTPSPGGSTASLFGATATPANLNLTDSRQLQLGVKFQTSTAGAVTAIRFYKGSQNGGPHVVTLWSSNGTLLASATSSSETSSGWQQVNLANPIELAANTTYIAAYHSSGYYSATPNYFRNAITSGPLTAPSGSNGVYIYGSSTSFPGSSYNSTNYWVDLVLSY